MNAALVLMTSAFVAGADAQAPPPAPVPPPVAAPGQFVPGHPAPCGDCGNPCGNVCDDGCRGRDGLLVRLRARFHKNKHDDCCCAAPVYAGFTTACCDPCERHGWGSGPGLCSGPGLFSRLRARFHKKDDCCDTGCSPCGPWGGTWNAGHWGGGCALPPVPGTVAPPPVQTAPKDMPKKDGGNTPGSYEAPAPIPNIPIPTAPPIPAGGSRSPF